MFFESRKSLIIPMLRGMLCFIVVVTGMVQKPRHQVIVSIYFYGAGGIFFIFFVSILSQAAINFDHLYASYFLLNNLVCLSVWTIIHLTVFINGLKSVISLKVEVVDIVKVESILKTESERLSFMDTFSYPPN